jgi:hypothetical protein
MKDILYCEEPAPLDEWSEYAPPPENYFFNRLTQIDTQVISNPMAFTDKSPAAWLGSGYTATPGKIELDDTVLQGLIDEDADEHGGDIRKLLLAIVDGLYTKFSERNGELAFEDKPTRISFTRSSSLNDSTGVITRNYTLRFDLEAASVSVAPEPTA